MAQHQAQALDVDIRELAPLHVAYIAYAPADGEPDFHAIQACFQRVQAWLHESGRDPFFGLTVGVAYPEGGQMARYDCCVEVPASVQFGTDEIAVQNLPGGRYAVLKMAKDPRVIGPSIGRLYSEHVPGQGLVLDAARPTYEVYWEDRMEYCAPLLAPTATDPAAHARWVQHQAERVLAQVAALPQLGAYLDSSLPVPKPYSGAGAIRLIILGQDPTVKAPDKRAQIGTALNLDKRGSLLAYLAHVCNGLGLDIRKDVYATNLWKGFFVSPPTQIRDVDVLADSRDLWLPLLQEELSVFPDAPVLTLGEPLLRQLVLEDASPRVRDYWGYTDDWRAGETGPLRYLEASGNRLGRRVFPFPHQPSIGKLFYKQRLDEYIAYLRGAAF